LDEWIEGIERSVIRSAAEEELYEEGKRIKLLKKLAGLKLTRNEWDEVKERERKWAPHFDSHIRFYEIAEERDRVFFENIQKIMQADENESLLFLAGGFHTKGISAQLREAGISYTVLVPRITTLADENRYLDVMQGNVSWKDHLKVRKGTLDLYEAFTEATVKRLIHKWGQVRNSNWGQVSNLSPIKSWRDGIIRQLAKEKRIEKAGDYTRFLDRAAAEMMTENDLKEIRSEWKVKLERFVEGLKGLVRGGELTDANVTQLFQAPAAAPVTDKPLFRQMKLPVSIAARMMGFAGILKGPVPETLPETSPARTAVPLNLHRNDRDRNRAVQMFRYLGSPSSPRPSQPRHRPSPFFRDK